MEVVIIGGCLCLATAARNLGKSKINFSDEMISRLGRAILGNLGGILLFNAFNFTFPVHTSKLRVFKAKYGTLFVFSIPVLTFTGAMIK